MNALSFLAVIVAIWRIDDCRRTPRPPTESLAESLRRRAAARDEQPRLCDADAAGRGGQLPGLSADHLPARVRRRRPAHRRAGYSLLLTSFGGGAILGAVATAHRGNMPGRGRRAAAGVIASTAVATAARDGLPRPARCDGAARSSRASAWSPRFSTLNSLVQENAPDALKGRDPEHLRRWPSAAACRWAALLAGALVRPLGVPLVLGALHSLSLSWPRARWPGRAHTAL